MKTEFVITPHTFARGTHTTRHRLLLEVVSQQEVTVAVVGGVLEASSPR